RAVGAGVGAAPPGGRKAGVGVGAACATGADGAACAAVSIPAQAATAVTNTNAYPSRFKTRRLIRTSEASGPHPDDTPRNRSLTSRRAQALPSFAEPGRAGAKRGLQLPFVRIEGIACIRGGPELDATSANRSLTDRLR